MYNNKARVAMKRAGSDELELHEIYASVEGFETLMDLYYEIVAIAGLPDGIQIVTNADAREEGLPENMMGIHGDMIFYRTTNGAVTSLVDTDIQAIKRLIRTRGNHQ